MSNGLRARLHSAHAYTGVDVQLKILQALPALLQNYSNELRGELLSSILQVCSSLQNAKTPAVSNTAAATLQQLVISVFDKVVVEDGMFGAPNRILTELISVLREITSSTNSRRDQARWGPYPGAASGL